MQDNQGASVPDQALVSDQASVPCPDPSGFDPSRDEEVDRLAAAYTAIAALDFAARQRALWWLRKRFDFEECQTLEAARRIGHFARRVKKHRVDAIATEAGTAETTEIGSVHEGAVGEAELPK